MEYARVWGQSVTMVARAVHAQPNMLRGLLAAGLIAWLVTFAIDLGGVAVGIFAAPIFNQDIEFWQFRSFPTMAMIYAIVGIPIALVVTGAIGWPLWLVLNSRGHAGYRNAAFSGALVGAAIAFFELAATYIYGQQLAHDPAFTEDSTYGFLIQRDGIQTALGWTMLGVRAAGTVLTGAAAGAAAWRFGKPRDA